MNEQKEYDIINPEEIIFPIITCNPKTKEWKCIGTGFFIHPKGGFVTAKHNCFEKENENFETLYGVQTTKSGERHLRPVINFVSHSFADIVIGFLGKRRKPRMEDEIAEIIPSLISLNFDRLENADELRTYAFPSSSSKYLEDEQKFELEFVGKWNYGKVIEFYTEGFSLLKGNCYRTSVDIKGGASGGPVLKGHSIVGVNSTGYDIENDEEPISFITPISYILELEVPSNSGMLKVIDLVKNGYIKSN